jgi:hypothetical protein
MKIRVIVAMLSCLVLVSGCTTSHQSANAANPPDTNRTPSRQPASVVNPSDANWGPQKGGLQTRLSPLTPDFQLGQPMLLRLEVRNSGSEWITYDRNNGYDTCWPYVVICPSGTRAHYTRGPVQTVESEQTMPPGSGSVLFDKSDLAARYLIVEPGDYTIQWRGEGGLRGLPPSNTLKLTVRPGKVSSWKLFAARLVPVIPQEKWYIGTYGTETEADSRYVSITMYVPLGGKRLASITVWTSDTPDNGSGVSWVTRECLGHSPLGYVHTAATQDAEKHWPSFRKDIAAALDVR